MPTANNGIGRLLESSASFVPVGAPYLFQGSILPIVGNT